MRQRISVEGSVRNILQMVLLHAPWGLKERAVGSVQNLIDRAVAHHHLHFEFERPGWGHDAKFTISWRQNEQNEYVTEVEVGWSSTTFSPASAVAAARLRLEAAEFACAVEAALKNQGTIVCEYDADLPKES